MVVRLLVSLAIWFPLLQIQHAFCLLCSSEGRELHSNQISQALKHGSHIMEKRGLLNLAGKNLFLRVIMSLVMLLGKLL